MDTYCHPERIMFFDFTLGVYYFERHNTGGSIDIRETRLREMHVDEAKTTFHIQALQYCTLHGTIIGYCESRALYLLLSAQLC